MQNFLHKHFDIAVKLLQQFDGAESLHFYLKKYFLENKKHGSKDRKAIAHFCYIFFRIGKNLEQFSTEERLKVALFLCENSLHNIKEILSEEWIKNHSKNLNERMNFIQNIYPDFSLKNIFPYENEFSESIDTIAFQESFLIQPKVFLRIRNKKKNIVAEKLNKANILFELIDETAVSIPQNININAILKINEEVLIQDLSSQRIASFFQFINLRNQKNSLIKVWDCCAASGGKSILAKDAFDKINLTVSDIRPQILQNLKKRFREANIHAYKSFAADLSKPISLKENFDLIICDAPCTGSGTWSRTPEMLAAFDVQQIDNYITSQKNIIMNVLPQLSKQGYFLYCTCSVFAKENEAIVDFIEKNSQLRCIKSETIKGYAQYADSMFAALFCFEK